MSPDPSEAPPVTEDDKPLRILVTMLHPGYARNYEGVFRILLERGHHIRLVSHVPAKQASDRIGERLGEEFATLTLARARKPERDGWRNMRWANRLFIDYTRYLHPRYTDSAALRDRVVDKMFGSRRKIGPMLAVGITLYVWVLGRFRGARYSEALITGLLHVERAIPTSERVDEAIETYNPDLVVATPYVAVGSREPDYLRSAKKLGIRTGLFVASWDNLTNKGLIKIVPDGVFMWNEAQKAEAMEMHRIPAENIIVTGAQRFDPWFEQRPYWSRDEFCRMVGLDSEHPYILYLCSSPFIAPDEVSFVERLLEAFRSSDSAMRNAGVLVRPHPQNGKQWIGVDLSHHGNVTVWPTAGEQPVDTVSRAGFYDSMAHSAAVVGINTSAQIEAGIVGRTVHTVLDPQFEHTQEGTLHFHHLLAENGGLLHVAQDIPELIDNLDAALTGRLDQEQTRRFIESFVRPHGLDVPATPLFADAVEALARRPRPAPEVLPRGEQVLRAILTPISYLAQPVTVEGLRKRMPSVMPRRRAKGDQAADAPVKVKSSDSAAKSAVRKAFIGAAKSEEGDGLVIVGPWLHDAGHELLYWVPFLRWATQEYHIAPERLVAVSRGGVSQWYRNVADRYVDVLDLVDPAVYQRALHDQGFTDAKKLSGTARAMTQMLDRYLRTELGEVEFLRPQLAHALFHRYWTERSSSRFVAQFVDMRRLVSTPAPHLDLALPDEFIAVQFSFNDVFPETESNHALARRIVEHLTQHVEVVALNHPLGDRGTPIDLAGIPGVRAILEDSVSQGSLAVQSEVISRSRGVIGTYGSTCQIATAHGVSSIGLYTEAQAVPQANIDETERMAHLTGAEFSLTHADAADLLAMAFRPRGRPARAA